MKSALSELCIFIGGALIGSSITYLVVKNKYEKIIDEEIESVKETYEDAYGEKTKTAKLVESMDGAMNPREKNQKAYEELIRQYKNDESTEDEEDEEDEEDDSDEQEGDDDDMVEPYIITPDEFGDTGYETICLTLYADGVIEDDEGDMWSDDDISVLLGRDSLSHMGENVDDPDVLYVRNENEEVDYEIARDVDKYFDEHGKSDDE